ncbi:MAG: hypothetical protein LBU88_00305 [Treponema sp.]|jgi:hypothetical protein|nr:hypothetical protein [Treponema sp.]
MTINFCYDELNNFGSLTAAGTFPNVINRGPSDGDNTGEASVERMTVDLKLPEGALAGAGPVTLSVQGSDQEAADYETIVTSGSIAIADLNKDGYGLPIPKTKFKYIRAVIAGSFAGTVQAIINSYIGK